VPNWSISRDDKVKLIKCQNHHHHGGVFDMWTKWARPQAKWAKGSAGRPNSSTGWPGFEVVQSQPWLPRLYMRRRSLSRWRKSVQAAPPNQSTTWHGRPTITWRQTHLSKSVEAPFTHINTPHMVKFEVPHSTCSSPLVNVPI
jgi:hypothetical protein